jgi:hypothetical protein
MADMKVKTNYILPPIPDRRFDWDAIDDDTYDGPGSAHGHGATEKEAIVDLLCQLCENECDDFIRMAADMWHRINVRDRNNGYKTERRRLTDDEFDDNYFSEENGDGPVY